MTQPLQMKLHLRKVVLTKKLIKQSNKHEKDLIPLNDQLVSLYCEGAEHRQY